MKKKRDKLDFCKKNYAMSFKFIRESRKFIFGIIAVFFAFAFIGAFLPTSMEISSIILEYIQEIIEQTKGMSAVDLSWFIFANNVGASFFGILLGIGLGIFPILVAAINGYLLGFVGLLSVQSNGIFSLWKLLPHGIFELTAVFISLGLGLKMGTFIFQKNKAEAFREYFWNSLRVFFFVVLPLLAIAAIIEGTLIAFFS